MVDIVTCCFDMFGRCYCHVFVTDGIVTIYYDVDVLADIIAGGNVPLFVIVAVGSFIANGWCYCHIWLLMFGWCYCASGWCYCHCKYSSCLADVIAKVVEGMPTTSAKHVKTTCHNINRVVITSTSQKETGYNIWPGGTTSTTIWHMAVTSAKHVKTTCHNINHVVITFCVAFDNGGSAITAISTPVFLHLLGLTGHILPLQCCWHQVEFCNYQLCSYLHHFGQTACQPQHTWKNFLTVQHLDCLCDLQIHELCWINFQHNLGWFSLLK